jgi:hypothetical protein
MAVHKSQEFILHVWTLFVWWIHVFLTKLFLVYTLHYTDSSYGSGSSSISLLEMLNVESRTGWSGSPSESSHSCSGTSRLYGPRRDSSWASFWRKKLVLWVYILVKSFVYTFFCFITISMCTNASTLIKSSQKCVSFIII